MSVQQPLPGVPVEPTTIIDQTHARERLLFEEALRDVPFGDLYAQLVDNGWYWRKAAVVAWLSMPLNLRKPQHQYELAALLGCSSKIVGDLKQRPEVQAAVMRLTLASLFEHKAEVDVALISSASNPDYKHNQDRKTFYTLIGALKDQHELTVKQADDAMRQKTDEELLALAALENGDEDVADE